MSIKALSCSKYSLLYLFHYWIISLIINISCHSRQQIADTRHIVQISNDNWGQYWTLTISRHNMSLGSVCWTMWTQAGWECGTGVQSDVPVPGWSWAGQTAVVWCQSLLSSLFTTSSARRCRARWRSGAFRQSWWYWGVLGLSLRRRRSCTGDNSSGLSTPTTIRWVRVKWPADSHNNSAQVSGDVYAVDDETLMLHNFVYDGNGKDTFFWAGSSNRPSSKGFIVPDKNGRTNVLGRSDISQPITQ